MQVDNNWGRVSSIHTIETGIRDVQDAKSYVVFY